MREKIEFDASADSEGRIAVPVEYVDEVRSKTHLHVTVEQEPSDKLNPGPFLRRVRESPFVIPGFKPLTRDEIYDE